jgi:hypothetical protein
LYEMKRWHFIVLAAAAVAVGSYVYLNGGGLGFHSLPHFPGASDSPTSDSAALTNRPARMNWRTVERPVDGFMVQMPSDPKDIQVPAYNEGGGSEQVKMIVANPDADTTFAVTWGDNPPVARMNERAPERTLDMARDGMLARTGTSLVDETRLTQRGSPGRQIAARNAGGGILDARLIFVGNRLYTLMALFPSPTARREEDVKRFFNSFLPARQSAIPDTMPSASPE